MSAATTEYRSPQSWITLAIFLALVVGVGGFIGSQTAPGPWFEELVKPPLNPPNWVFGPVWFTLYVMIAVAGWRIWMDQPKSTAMTLWGVQMLLNWAWSPSWFGANMPWLALAIIVALWLVIVGFIVIARKRDQLAAWLFVPYLAWVSFATYLNLSIAVLNA
ncbi:MAG: TspO/MBR family protein [Devosia marina]|uniref:TspO/MBR family protein n=1 Tax=Devosia marina TaxID=2683198 RepID=UPI0032EE9DAC